MTNMPARAKTSGVAAGGSDKGLSGLRITIIFAVVMLVAEIGLGFEIARNVNVPAKDNGSRFFVAIGRALTNGPVAITVHAALGLLLIATAVVVIIRAIAARRMLVFVFGALGTLAIVAADANGARFISNGKDAESNTMKEAAIAAIVCYLLCLALTLARRPGRR